MTHRTMTEVAPPPFAARLVAWQRVHGRNDLPWQNTDDPCRVRLAEIMLQPTQVATIIPYCARFVAVFPGGRALATAPLCHCPAPWLAIMVAW
jgi:A/G-specific adenine glycosylase